MRHCLRSIGTLAIAAAVLAGAGTANASTPPADSTAPSTVLSAPLEPGGPKFSPLPRQAPAPIAAPLSWDWE